MEQSKKLLAIVGVMIVLVAIFFAIRYNLFTRSEEGQLDQTTSETTEEIQMTAEESAQAEAEAKAAEEAAKIAAEEAAEAARLEREKAISENSRYVKENDTPIYKSVEDKATIISTLDQKTLVYISKYYVETTTQREVEDSANTQTNESTDQNSSDSGDSDNNVRTVTVVSNEEVPAGTEGINWVEIKSSYDAISPLGIVSYDALTNTLADFIARPYENVDYEPFDKTDGYESNPSRDVKGVYVTGNSASTNKINDLIRLADETEINTFIIDVKDDNGYLLFHSDAAETMNPKANDRVYIDDIEAFIETMKAHDIYLIARIVTFKSPIYAKENPDQAIVYSGTDRLYSDADGLIWASAHNRDLWEYNVAVAKEAAALGFNEIQFDYVRFPAISNKGQYDFRNPTGESQVETIQSFLKYAYQELSPFEVYIGADVFGWAATAINDVGIGQHWEALSNVVDFICPMVYPSHYGPNIFGLPVPDAAPYDTILQATKDAKARNSNIASPGAIRPWIQDFTATWVKGHIKYGADEVALQIKALNDEGITSYMLWNSKNNYSEEALK